MTLNRFTRTLPLLLAVAACGDAGDSAFEAARPPGAFPNDTPDSPVDSSVVVRVADYIGLEIPPMPPEVDDLAGSVVRDPDAGYTARARHVVDHVRVGATHMLWLSRVVDWVEGANNSERPVLRVADVVELPPVGTGRHVVLYGCHGEDGMQAFALLERDADGAGVHVVRAWRADQAEDRLVPAATAAVTCDGQ